MLHRASRRVHNSQAGAVQPIALGCAVQRLGATLDATPFLTKKVPAENDSTPARRRALALIALGAATLCFSLVPLAVRFSEVGPTATAFWRFALAIVPVLLWMQVSAKQPRRTNEAPKNARRILILISISLAADMVFWHAAVAHTSVVNSMLIAYSNPIFVAIGAWILLKERFGRQFMAGLVLALVGAFLLVSHGSEAFGSFALGDYLAIVAAAFFSIYIIGMRSVRRHYSTVKVVAWNTIIPTPLLLIAALALGETVIPQTANGWAILAGYAFIVHVLGQGLFTYAFAQLPAAFNAVAILGSPLIATILAWVLIGEAMTALQMLYGVIVLVGIYLAHRGSTVTSKH